MAPVRLHVLVRSPRLGQVKTRLAASIGNQAALAFYRAFAADVFAAVDACGVPAVVWADPAADMGAVRLWLGGHRQVLAQPSGDLGARLHAALVWSFQHGDQAAAVIGCDIPLLRPELLIRAATALADGQAVLGPSPDGGYWCIGFTEANYRPQVFVAMPWSTPDLYACSLRVLQGMDLALLPSLADIDTGDDLLRLSMHTESSQALHTRTLLREWMRTNSASVGDCGVR